MKNEFGDRVVRFRSDATGTSAKIGQSLVTSETIYAEGLPILEKSVTPNSLLAKNLKSIILCDNPGFHDTRGSEYEICTNMSID